MPLLGLRAQIIDTVLNKVLGCYNYYCLEYGSCPFCSSTKDKLEGEGSMFFLARHIVFRVSTWDITTLTGVVCCAITHTGPT